MRPRRWIRIAAIGLAAVAGFSFVAAGAGWLWLRGRLEASLPALEGELPLRGLAQPVTIERDELGVPTVRGSSRLDLHRAMGFLHAQERFFQMDLLRRQAAGELAELFGAGALELDRSARLHRFRSRAERALGQAGPGARELLEAYADGVNAGLAALGEVPPEYLALRTRPRAWLAEDSVLVVSAMYLLLQGQLWRRESDRGVLYDCLPRELADFLAPGGTEWDAAIDGSAPLAVPPPGPEIHDLRHGAARDGPQAREDEMPPKPGLPPGSNSMAVAGRRTADGRALLGNDMHLPLALPNVWYRAVLEVENERGSSRIVGVTLPGMPVVVVGSTGRIAWGFTNSQGDWADLVVLESDVDPHGSYLTPDGPRPFEIHDERILVRGGPEARVEVRETSWGPVVDRDHRGRERVLRWVAHGSDAANTAILALEAAADVDEALAVAARSGLPEQNFLVADAGGRIAWTLAGRIPRRTGTADATVPLSWREAGEPWHEWLDPADHPRVVDPPSGVLWTANNRVVGAPALAAIGDGGFDLAARATQLRDGLLEIEAATEADLLRIQLDDRALLLERWRALLLETLDEEAVAGDPRRAELRRQVERGWSGRASIDSVGYRVVRGFRQHLAGQVFDAITAACRQVDDRFDFRRVTAQEEGPLWALVTQRPPHLLDPRFSGWRAQLLAAVDALLDGWAADGDTPLAARTWGARNRVRLGHPLSLAVPQLSRWLDLEPTPLPGDADLPRVQAPRFGASERLAVAPGAEQRGIFHMPGGQSGHPLSPHYRRGHEAWVGGEATPLLPGPVVQRLILVPADGDAPAKRLE